MDLIDLLNDHADLPRMAAPGGAYIDELRSALFGYAGLAAGLTGADRPSALLRANAAAIQELAEHLVAVHDATLSGRELDARDAMHQAIAAVRASLDTLTSVPMDRDGLGWVFRLRSGAHSDRVARAGLFHIPFDQRHLVSPMRYSMLGIPMLYLGGTTYTCWEELRRPSFDDVWVCGLRLRDEARVRLIAFGYRPTDMAAMLHANAGRNAYEDHAVAYATVWPLIAACSFRKRYRDARFAEEYVIPQRLVAYLVETAEFAGIRYFSTHINAYQGPLLGMNFVFPARPGTSAGQLPASVRPLRDDPADALELGHSTRSTHQHRNSPRILP